MSVKKRDSENVIVFTFGVCLTFFLYAAITWRMGHSIFSTVIFCVLIGLLYAEFRYSECVYSIGKMIIKYRWLCAAIIFAMCVLLRIHGSSIGVYNIIFPTKTVPSYDTLFGIPRTIRSDEWAVQAPTFFSQYYNNYAMYSHQMSVSGTNMVLDYYSPVANILVLGKPLSWGYLLFGNEVGISWNWCGLVILIFMGSFEMFYILSRRTTWISVVGMLMVGLSPAVQWWVMPHMPIVFAYAMLLYCVGYYFFTSKTRMHKLLFSVLAVFLLVGYALSLFPSCQIPCGLLMVSLLVVTLLRDKKDISFSGLDYLRTALVGFFAVSILAYFAVVSKDDLYLLMNTVYPGQRISVGGDQSIYDLFTNLYSMFLPYKDSNVTNNCETSTYIHFAPFFMVLYPKFYKAQGKEDGFGRGISNVLFIALTIEAAFMCIGIPEWLAKITLLKYVNRMEMVFGWTGTIFSCYGFYVLWRYPSILKKWEKIVYPIVYSITFLFFVDDTIREYLPVVCLMIELALFSVVLLFAVSGRRRLLCYLVAGMMFFCGGTVNPVSRGIGAITNHPIYSLINDISNREPEARWIVLDSSFSVSNYIMACGAKTLDATQFLPDIDKWEIIDADDQFEFETNRYSNQQAILTEEKNSIELLTPDCMLMKLNPETLKNLGVSYMVSMVDYSDLLSAYDIEPELVFEQDGYMICSLQYAILENT